MTFYLDTSAWVKRYCQESGTPWVRDLFARKSQLACSKLGLVEVTAALARKLKFGDIDASLHAQSSKQLGRDWDHILQMSLTEETIDRSKDIARDQALRGADAIHLASALLLEQRLSTIDRLVLVTSDRELAAAARASGLAVADPGDQDADAPRKP